MTTVRQAIEQLADAGVASPQRDARELLAYVLDSRWGQVALIDEVPTHVAQDYAALIARRANREPLQHLLGVAGFRTTEVHVGPGVFIPRPETELLAGWAIEQCAESESPVVVDLCTGSGAIARAIAIEAPHARVYAAELDHRAADWARHNLRDMAQFWEGDMAAAFPELDGTVDVLTCNPPYIPLEAWESVDQEARDHDPDLALFAGLDGLDAFRVLEVAAARLLRPGGVVGAEHADVQGESAPAVFHQAERWTQLSDHDDLAGRARFVTARLAR